MSNPEELLELLRGHRRVIVALRAERDALLEALLWTARALDKEHPAAIKARAVIAAVENGMERSKE